MSKISILLPTVPKRFRRLIPPDQQNHGRSVGPSVRRWVGRRWNSYRGPSDGWFHPTDRPTVRRSVRRSVGLSEEVKFIQRAVKSLRKGDTGDKWNRRSVGRSERRGRKRAEWESVTLESRTVGRSVGWRIGKLVKQNDWKIMKVLCVEGTWVVRTKEEIDPQVTYSGWRSLTVLFLISAPGIFEIEIKILPLFIFFFAMVSLKIWNFSFNSL